MASNLCITHEKKDDVINVKLNGEVDINTADDLRESLYSIIDHTADHIKLDCSDLNYIDSTGLGVLVAVLKKVKGNQKNVYITNIKKTIKKLFIITGLDKVFIIEE